MVSTRKTRPMAVVAVWSSSVVKKRATSAATSSIEAMRVTNWALEGQATRTSSRSSAGMGCRLPRAGSTRNRFATTITLGTSTIVRAMTVAHAAPSMPSRGACTSFARVVAHASRGGAGPSPNTSMAASGTLSAFPSTSKAAGVFAEPSARWMVASWSRKKMENEPPTMTRR